MAALSQAVEPCIATYDTTTALCLAHCQVTFFFFFPKTGNGRVGEIRFYLSRCRKCGFSSAKTLSKNKLQQYEGGGKAPRRLAFAEATALAEI